MERIRDKANAERYDRMIAKREEQIAEAKKQIEELQNISEMLRSRQAKLKRDISLIDDILQDGEMSEAHLKMLVEKILVHEEDGKLDLEIRAESALPGSSGHLRKWGANGLHPLRRFRL